jgi:hypothetical protein
MAKKKTARLLPFGTRVEDYPATMSVTNGKASLRKLCSLGKDERSARQRGGSPDNRVLPLGLFPKAFSVDDQGD